MNPEGNAKCITCGYIAPLRDFDSDKEGWAKCPKCQHSISGEAPSQP